MKDFKNGAKYIFDFTKNVIEKFGPRLPGSDEERAAANDIADTFTKETGSKAVKEKFLISPHAGIGGIPIMGVVAFIALGVYFACPLAGAIISTLLFIFAVSQVFTYVGWFDMLFPKAVSTNVYSVIEARKKPEYTIVYSGHMDSSWDWNHSALNPKTAVSKIIIGVVAVIALAIIGFVNYFLEIGIGINNTLQNVFTFLPLIFVPCYIWLVHFLSWDKRKASPGAMDNLTGVGLALYMGNQIKENPEMVPDNCRVVVLGLGAEEAGLKGSFEFAKKHAKDDLLINPYIVNLDSFRDYDHFNVVKGDLWLGSHFDKDMIDMSLDCFKEAGFKESIIFNPIGGCDSTPFYRKGFRTVTLNAQNPIATDYYHTFRDDCDGLDMNTLEKSCEIVENLTDKIHKHFKENK